MNTPFSIGRDGYRLPVRSSRTVARAQLVGIALSQI
jgi:hypothetical protein